MVLLRRHPPPHTMADSTSPPSVLPPVNPLEFKPGSLNSEAGSFPRRGRWGWRDWFGFYLPRYDGPHSVGTLTLELPVPKPFSDYQLSSPLKLVKPPNEPALQLHSSLFTLFYPTDAEPRRAESRLKWISLSQIKGYLRFAGIGSWKRFLAIPLALLTMGQTRLPTRGGAPIAPTDGSKRKLVLFCHGLTGNRTCYSQLCGQLAARGYVVAALEHRDSSGSHSVANRVAGKTRSAVEVPYVDMDDLTPDTRPENYLYARAYQLELRTLELLAASKLLGRLAEPDGWKWVRSENLRVKGSAGWTGDDGASWDEREWARFAGAVRWSEDVITAGHSFGGATVLACARHPLRPAHWTKFILYDPWLETLDYWPRGSPALMAQSKIEFPSLVINSPGFTDWPSHFGSLVRVVEESRKSWLLTVGGIIHSSFSDLPILAERLWRLVGQLEFDSQHALDLITRASIEFIEDKPGAVLNQKGASSKQLLSRPRELPLGTVHLHVKPCEEKASR